MADTIADLLVKIGADTNEFNNALGKMDKTAKDKFGNIKKYADKLAMGMGAAGVAIAGIGTVAVGAAGDFELLKTRLQLVEGSAAGASAKFEELMGYAKASTAFSLDQFVTASNVMETMKKGSSELIPAIAGMSEAMGTDLNMAAAQIARAMNGDSRAFLVLERQLGLTKEKLKEFNSDYDETGKAAERNGQILSKYLNETYGGNLAEFAKTNKSLMGELQLTIKELGAEIGTSMLPVVKDMTGLLTGLINKLKEMDPETKKNVGSFLMFAPPILLAGSALVGLAGSLGNVVTAFGGASVVWTASLGALKSAIVGVTTALGPLGIVMAAIVAAGLTYNQQLKEEIRLQKELQTGLKDDDKIFRAGLKLYKDYQNGKKISSEEATKLIEFNEKYIIPKAYKSGSDSAIKAAELTTAALREIEAGSKQTANQIVSDSQKASQAFSVYYPWSSVEDQISKLENLHSMGKISAEQTKELIGLYKQMERTAISEKPVFVSNDEQRKAAKKASDEAQVWHDKALKLTDEEKSKVEAAEKLKQDAIKKTADAKKKAAAEAKILSDQQYQIEVDNYNAAYQVFADNDREKKRIESEAIAVTKEIQDEINRINMSESDYKIYKINEEIEAYRRKGATEIQIAEFIEAKKKELVEGTVGETKKATTEAINEADKLLKKFERIGGEASPLMSLEEFGATSAARFADKKKSGGKAGSGTAAAPDISKLGMGDIGKAQANMDGQPKSQTVTVNIGNFTVEGKQAQGILNALSDVTGLKTLIDQTESVD